MDGNLMITLAAIPIGDWQFWLVTLVAIAALVAVVRPLFPRRKGSNAACPGCPSGAAKSDTPQVKRVDLTIGGKRVRRG